LTTELIDEHVWTRLRDAARKCRRSGDVAVAYFGKGASKLLPLRAGSRLVVDASEAAVRSGQTCPDDLLRLLDRGVNVFSYKDLHAKVYVFGNRAFVGSANASHNSSERLIEVLLATTERSAVAAARKFVHGLCKQRLTPTVIKRLNKIYRPPNNFGQARGKKKQPSETRRTIPPVKLALLKLESWPEKIQQAHDRGLTEAKRRRQRRARYLIDAFRWSGNAPFKRDDIVMQVTDDGNGRKLMSPPGPVVHVRRFPSARKSSFVYVEIPSETRRRSIKAVAKQLGERNAKRFQRGGLVSKELANKLLAFWSK